MTLKFSLKSLLCGVFITATAHASQVCQPDNVPATTGADRFEQKDDGTLIDKKTGLMWQRCLVGKNGKNCNSGSASEFTWAEALAYPTEKNADTKMGGHKDWRLPNVRELASIVELQCHSPAANEDLFPGMEREHLWTSSPYRFYPHYSWYLDMSEGMHTYGERIHKKTIRLVRDVK